MRLPQGYTARTPTTADAEEAVAVIAACRADETGASDITTEELLSDWQGLDLAEEAVVIVGPDGHIRALGDVWNRRHMRVSFYGYVHPEHRQSGLGTYLVQWAEEWIRTRLDRAPAGVEVVLEFYANGANSSAQYLLETRGYPHVRTVYVMEVELSEPPPQPAWPPGIEVRTYIPGADEHVLFEAGEDAFRDSWSHAPGTLQGWTRGTRADTFDPDLWFLPVDRGAGEVAGVCLTTAVSGQGWVNSLGVRPTYRRQGLGLALLRHALGAFYARGISKVGLSVDADSPTGAPRLYTRAGLRVMQHYHVYRRQIRPGKDFTQWTGEDSA